MTGDTLFTSEPTKPSPPHWTEFRKREESQDRIRRQLTAERDWYADQVRRVRDLHRRMGIYEPCLSYPEDCPKYHFETNVGEHVHGDDLIRWACETCRDEYSEPLDHPCPTINALEDR